MCILHINEKTYYCEGNSTGIMKMDFKNRNSIVMHESKTDNKKYIKLSSLTELSSMVTRGKN